MDPWFLGLAAVALVCVVPPALHAERTLVRLVSLAAVIAWTVVVTLVVAGW